MASLIKISIWMHYDLNGLEIYAILSLVCIIYLKEVIKFS
jgi:hypothetical protein